MNRIVVIGICRWGGQSMADSPISPGEEFWIIRTQRVIRILLARFRKATMVQLKLQAQDIVVIKADWVLASHRGESVCKID